MKRILMTFNTKTGETKIEADGFVGKGCAKATEFLKSSLGTMTDFKEKEEWFQTNLELNGDLNTDYCG